MALNKDILGLELYNVRAYFSNRDIDDLIQEFGTMEAVRLEVCKREAEAIINHFKNYANVVGNVATTGTSTAQTGAIVAGTGKVQ